MGASTRAAYARQIAWTYKDVAGEWDRLNAVSAEYYADAMLVSSKKWDAFSPSEVTRLTEMYKDQASENQVTALTKERNRYR